MTRRYFTAVLALVIALASNVMFFYLAKRTAPSGPAEQTPAPPPVVETSSGRTGTYPVICAGGGTAFLVGGFHESNPLDESELLNHLSGGHYRLYTLAGAVGEATGAKPRQDSDGHGFLVAVQPPWRGEEAIGIDCPWDPQPRPPTRVEHIPEAYRAEIEHFIVEKGIVAPRFAREQYVRVDLDGDGIAEELFAASIADDAYPDFQPRAGDFSCVLLRLAPGAKAGYRTVAGEFYPRPPAKQNLLSHSYSIAGILDVDGDGAEEILIKAQYYEGKLVAAFAVKGGTPVRLFSGLYGL